MKTTLLKTEKTATGKNRKTLTIPRVAGKIGELLKVAELEKKGSNYNGFGYDDWTFTYTVPFTSYKEIKKELTKPKKQRKFLSFKEQKLQWAKRLIKLIDDEDEITLAEALMLAEEKIEAQENQIQELIERQNDDEYPSSARDTLIRKLERANPLRRIADIDHAWNIMAARKRHNNTNYEDMLVMARDLAEIGEIDKSEVKEWARKNYTAL